MIAGYSFLEPSNYIEKKGNTQKRHYTNQQIEKLNNLQKDNPKEFWRILQNLKDDKGKTNHSDKIEPGTWYDYIMNKNQNQVPAQDEKELQNFINKNRGKCFNELDTKISNKELQEAINKIKRNKTPGLDLISNEMICCGNTDLNQCLLHLFNKYFH